MGEIDLKSNFISDEDLKNLKEHIMKWYSDSGNHEIDINSFYKDALEDLMSVIIYGRWGEHTKTNMLINSWIREFKKAAGDKETD